MRLACCLIAFGLLAPAAVAQQPAPPAPPPPPAPDLVLSGRDVRMTRANIANVRVGCRASDSQPGEACIGTLTLRLATTVSVRAPRRPGDNNQPRERRIPPFNLATRSFQLSVGRAVTLKLRVTPLTGRIVRERGRVPLRVIGVYVSRAGVQGQVSRGVSMYFPRRPSR